MDKGQKLILKDKALKINKEQTKLALKAFYDGRVNLEELKRDLSRIIKKE